MGTRDESEAQLSGSDRGQLDVTATRAASSKTGTAPRAE
jgi:hypothetical protein